MKICVATGTRAEYGLLKPLMEKISAEASLQLQILVTASHLSPEFGLTYKMIEQDGFQIDYKTEMLLSSDSDEGIVKSMGIGMIGFADALKNLQPDLLLVLGDRYEMLALVSSALIFKIPVAHLHGGELTEGAYDDAIRNAITKMSHYHFASTESYKNRILQMGENPQNVHNVGAIGLDNIKNLKLLSKEELEQQLDVQFKKFNYQVTFHPATLDAGSPEEQFQELLQAIDLQEDSFFVFTKANADSNGRIINQLIDDYVQKNPEKSAAFNSLGSLRFLSLVKICDAMVGNSSSGIAESPFLGTPTINIGNRQKGRLQTNSIINTSVNSLEISKAFDKIKTAAYRTSLTKIENPYGDGNTAEKIIAILKNLKPDFHKTFFDYQK